MITKRMINCDFLNASGFLSNLSNKAKLLYFMYLTNADDRGFVANAIELADTLDRCEENFDNVLFAYKYSDAIQELVDKRLVFQFVDKCNNKTFLIRHWFYHNKMNQFMTTNFNYYLAKVELIDNEYHLRNKQEKETLKKEKIKENKINKSQKSNILEKVYDNDNSDDTIEEIENTKDKEWDNMLKELESFNK